MLVYIVVCAFIVADILTGFLKALYQGNLNSTNLRKGLYHKASEVIAVLGAGLLEHGIEYVNLGVELPMLNLVSVYICLSELVSILENLSDVNPTLSKLFKPYLEKLKTRESENDDTKKGD